MRYVTPGLRPPTIWLIVGSLPAAPFEFRMKRAPGLPPLPRQPPFPSTSLVDQPPPKAPLGTGSPNVPFVARFAPVWPKTSLNVSSM